MDFVFQTGPSDAFHDLTVGSQYNSAPPYTKDLHFPTQKSWFPRSKGHDFPVKAPMFLLTNDDEQNDDGMLKRRAEVHLSETDRRQLQEAGFKAAAEKVSFCIINDDFCI